MILVSVEEVKVYLEKTDDTHDPLLFDIISQVSKRIESALNRGLEKLQRTAYFNGGRRVYLLPAYPIDEAQTLTVTENGTVRTKDTDFFVWPDVGMIEFKYATSDVNPKNIVIVWTGGYGKDADNVLLVPDDLKRAAVMQASFEFRRRKDLGLGYISMPDGSVTVQSPAELLPEVKEIIKYYRLVASEL